MEEEIRHEGVVLTTEGEMAQVEILQTSACAACKAKQMCMSAESQQKIIDAVMTEPMKAGDQVEVVVREHLAWEAVLLAYVMPFVLMVGVIAALDYRTELSEAVTGTLSLCALAVYFLVLRMFKHRLQKQFSFTARKV